MADNRLSYEDSFRFLQQEGWERDGPVPPIPSNPPQYDDEILGLSFFRTCLTEATLKNLTLPRVYFGRTEISKTSFAGSDLTESVANWNDFEDVDFTAANLTSFDFRACVLRRVKFNSAILTDADLRCCTFDQCSFTGAEMKRAKLTRTAGTSLDLSDRQKLDIDWQDEDGPEPGGG